MERTDLLKYFDTFEIQTFKEMVAPVMQHSNIELTIEAPVPFSSHATMWKNIRVRISLWVEEERQTL